MDKKFSWWNDPAILIIIIFGIVVVAGIAFMIADFTAPVSPVNISGTVLDKYKSQDLVIVLENETGIRPYVVSLAVYYHVEVNDYIAIECQRSGVFQSTSCSGSVLLDVNGQGR